MRARSLPAWSAPAALGGILVLAALLYGWALGSLGWSNFYYSTTAKSMGGSWANFLLGSYDPAGVITVDKPPAALWPQVVSSKIFGLHGWALVLPQLLEGVAAVLVLHRTVRRWAGEGAGLLAALVLTLTPITVAINRDNNPDTLLVLLLVSAAYALTRALQASAASAEGRAATLWLCASGFLIGCGFLTKMLAAWMVVPAFAAAWLIGAAGTWASRLWRLLAAGAVLAVSSLWWIAMFSLWPGDRPYMGGSKDGSAWDLVIGYNGLGRIFDSKGAGMQGAGASFGGTAGVTRLFNQQVAGQISWLLPTCAVALAVAVAGAVLRRRGGLRADAVLPGYGWVLWGMWLVVCGALFSTQKGVFHPYYTTELAPAIAALCGGLASALARAHRAGARWVAVVAPAAVAVTTAWAAVIIRRSPDWHGWLVWPVLAAGCVAVALLLVFRLRGRALPAALACTVGAVLLAPAAWSVSVPGSEQALGGLNPMAGPPAMQPVPYSLTELTSTQRKILDYVSEQAGTARITLAVERGAMLTTPYILGSDKTVIGMGGFTGDDNAPSIAQLEKWIKRGELRYTVGADKGAPGPRTFTERTEWISRNCAKVPPAAYGVQPGASSKGTGGPAMGLWDDVVLYDCAPR
ncbi:ArnT family glycosyltransferase [Streptomyces sichuanensis]|uniref:ArnT family glycosyltransferase n=1 Tax=Streptomyces sichuanensis TaxID=2871810 RepID=UPI001CE370F0|nr:glycosyltransferase family 39 protein [Streptomyces sichuanensis]